MAALYFAKTLFVASLLVLVISSEATRAMVPPPSAPPPTENEGFCMKHKLVTEDICHDICSNIGFNSYHSVPFTAVDPDSICCCCAPGSNCVVPPARWP